MMYVLYHDHLGNIILSFADRDKDGKVDVLRNNTDIDGDNDNHHEIKEVKDYYPFGLQINYGNNSPNSLITGRKHNYGYNGVEHTEDLSLNLYEMDLRQYDPAIARWTSIDPVTHHSMSTYNAFDNNPVYWADPSGADGEHYNWETKKYEDDKGKEVSFGTAMASQGLNTDGSSQTDPKKEKKGKKGKASVSTGNLEMQSVEKDRSEMPASLHAMDGEGGYTTSFDGNINQYNSQYGTDYQEGDLGSWYYDNYYAPELSALRGSIQAAQGDAAELIMDVGLTIAPIGEIVIGSRLIYMGVTKVSKASQLGYRAMKVGHASSKGLRSSAFFTKILRNHGLNRKFFAPTLYGSSKTLGTFLGRNSPVIGTGLILDGSRRLYNITQ